MKPEIRVAAVQLEPVFMDANATTNKVCELIDHASKAGANLIVFPECTIPMYPNWPQPSSYLSCPTTPDSDDVRTLSWEDYWNDLVTESVALGDELVARLSEAARHACVVVVIGVNERVDDPGGPHLYNTALVFGVDGQLIGYHRKLIPVLHEKLYHSPGGLKDIAVFHTEVGRIGIGICFENLHPGYRYALLRLGEEIHCSLWVSTEPDKHLMNVSAQQHAIEGGIFVVAAGQVTSRSPSPGKYGYVPSYPFVGGSAIISPQGELLAGPSWGHEDILYATLNRNAATRARSAFDLLGRDGRVDLFESQQGRQTYQIESKDRQVQFTAPVKLLRAETALIIVDMQYNDASPNHGFCLAREKWRLTSIAYYVARLQQHTIPTIKRLQRYFRACGFPILFLVLGGRSPKLEDMSPRVVEALVGSVKREMGVDLRNSYAEGSFEFQILEELAPRKGEEVIRKTTYGAFNSTDLEERLRRQGITSLVITGVTTSACVETTARDAADRGFGVVLVDEGTCDWDQEYHLASLRAFRRLFGDVAKSAEDVIEALEEGKAVPRS